ncbi:serine/threonine-protein kinase Nek1 isoform X1 [Girardinichthys multiradiatus]|uniref:serine/threonine-protein kinase Nek1 isoform X1 n=1 Tax=Girardinichthys multiradiatus TaxID=208333 RepID=UPI001FADE8EE|nr:serine/threonine-protein kinase Nek1 isoform X1 [Girardinichthys multiradiatus]XP_047231161.1 serine/threonine-protein kinase Nek1 isoform X1 [Girardinichthys multiradiatus]
MENYEKVKQIGEGSFGKAILVKSKDDRRQYVIKEIGISGMSSKERQESRREVAVLANMSHPNIVQYKESFEEEGCLYIVMDYCEGGDLFKKINSQKGVLFPEEQILDWFVQICLALKHVHDRKILHRDIKSQNIFLTKEGTVQLGDFGIARVLNSTVELARTCIGTPYYLSPEICENKPYNNKSDIWALGCVLYEMCTLKHAFEAGNMKNLVLKIIRGSYPPVSVHYSQELRSLLAQLFKRNPRERPSIGSILDKPFLSCRIERFLTPQIIAQEFRHTFLHKQPKMGVAQVPPAQKVTKPACKYGVPLTVRKVGDGAKKSSERKAAVKHKPALLPAAPQRRISQVEEERKKQEDGIRKKRMELIEKERKQREQVFLLKGEQIKRYEKEKISRINQAREQGWKHFLSSSGGSSPERKCFVGGKRAVGVQGSGLGLSPAPNPTKSPYENHYAALDQMVKSQPKETSREGSSAGPGSPIRGIPAAAGPVLPNGPAQRLNSDVIKRELQRLHHVSKQAQISRQRGQIPAERAFQVEEFLQRKREAMLNKVRAEGQLGTRQNLAAIYGSRAGAARCRRPKVNREEEEYLARLRQIRLQNFNERQQIKARLRGEKYDSDGSDSQESSEEADLRRKKIEVLKAQANARVAVLKEQLEKKRREAYEREKRAWEDHLAAARGAKCGIPAGSVAVAAGAASSTSECPPQAAPFQPDAAVKASALPTSKPSTPSISMTAALENVGAMTPLKETLNETETATVSQSEKKQILRRLNQNMKAQSPVDELEETPPAPSEPSPSPQQEPLNTEKRPLSDGDRKKWEVAEIPLLPVPQQTFGETCSTSSTTLASPEERPSSGGDRKKWEAGAPLVLSVAQQTLEETCITTIDQMRGEVIRMGELQENVPSKVWEENPVCEGLKELQGAKLQPHTHQPQIVTISDGGELLTSAVDQRLTDGNQEASLAKASLLPNPTDIQDSADLESVVLEEIPKQASNPPAKVQQAWEQEAQKQMPQGGVIRPTDSQDIGKRSEKPTESSCLAQHEEPLFLKCSPAHRRTAALSAQSSMDESSSSLASRSRSVSPLRSKNQNALLIDLSAGMFDANNPKMLRTCSLPDLSRLFSPQQDSAVTSKANVSPDKDLEIEDLEEAVKDDDQSDAEDAYEDDLRDIRASMERLLQEESDRSPPDVIGAGDFNGNPPQDGDNELFNRMATELDQDNQMAVDDDEDDEDEEEDEDEDEECSNGSPGDDEAKELLSNGVGDERQNNGKQLNEDWQSDGSIEDQGVEGNHHDSIFSRLEELRFNLEQQMGFEKFIEAYNKIKAIHEDEDENIELGSSLVSNILGTEHQHLYPNILHLVMADGAYQEDNDE